MQSLDLAQIVIAFGVLLFSLTVHEAAHAFTADRLGDPTARRLGRVSLNPAVHVDLIGTIVFPLIAISTNLPVIGWAKPVPVDGRNLRDFRRDFVFIAAAGPASNLMLALVAAFAFRVLAPSSLGSLADQGSGAFTQYGLAAVWYAVNINVLLAIFNMIPIPPLDGGNVLAGLLPLSLAHAYDRVRPWGFLLLYALMLTGMLSVILGPPRQVILSWLL